MSTATSGSWEGRLSAEERATKYKCPVQTFSRAGNLTDPNINPHYLAKLTRVGINKAVFKPSKDAIQARYYTNFSAGGKLPEEQEEEEALGPAPAPALAPAPEKSPAQSPRRCARLSPGKS